MPPEIVREWLNKADEDYGFACAGMEFADYFGQICFHFQQAAEKYLKAFIIANELRFRPVHNLLEPLAICREASPDAEELHQACSFLNPFYIDTRYPVHWPTAHDASTAVKARQATEQIRDWVLRSLTV
jgi:HEPN domain-containing protein